MAMTTLENFLYNEKFQTFKDHCVARVMEFRRLSLESEFATDEVDEESKNMMEYVQTYELPEAF